MIALTLAGCGGDEPAPEATPDAPPAPPTAAAATEEAAADYSPLVSEDFPVPFPEDRTVVPDEIASKLDQVAAEGKMDRPLIIYFTDAALDVTDDSNAEIDAVIEEYRGLADVFKYPLQKDFANLEDGKVVENLSMDERVYKLADALGIKTTPYVVLVGKDGQITWAARGFIDATVFERNILTATE